LDWWSSVFWPIRTTNHTGRRVPSARLLAAWG